MISEKKQRGLIHIYTGEGKGKTTAAIGLAIRAKSRGLRVLFAQFMKGNKKEGELELLENLSITIKRFDRVVSPHFYPNVDKEKLKSEANKSIRNIKKIMSNNDFDLIALDEFNCLLAEGLLTEDEALDLITNKPEGLELVLTGRGATERLIEAADYVTEMKMVKHPFSKGIRARKGIEY
ncbi:MAG: cob(I)yrinic acid a,c-diamide adenosyltransferase [Nitrospirae bacterium]|nr:cob(I)yrinic acid a,c-diamide adenosyltransferase [Nitrospirota bacterium]